MFGTPAPASQGDGACGVKRSIFTAHDTATALRSKLARLEPVRILAIGSSSTQGVGATSPDFSYPAQLEDELSDAWKSRVTVINAGRGGETSLQTVERLEKALMEQPFDLVIWQVGTNDALKGVTEEVFRTTLERGITAVKASGTSLILLDQQYFPTIRDLGRYERFVGMVSAMAQEQKVAVFSRYALMQDWNSQSPGELRSMLAGDGFHMSDRGYDCLADQVADAIQALVGPVHPSGSDPSKLVAGAR